ncbi:hypothetical protein FKP32DRAFT_1607850 [Trametes sanguinea]|nr:hypothetical protein FKP32DRAFT_1607850 [Trametes sanguinea]
MPPSQSATAILGRVRGQANALLPLSPDEAIVAYFDIPIPPKTPIKIGDRVKLFSLTPCNYLLPHEEDGRPRYTAKPTGIEGTVVAFVPREGNLVELVLRNENERSTVTHASMTIEHVNGVTTQLGLAARLLRWLLSFLITTTRIVPLEPNAIIYNDTHRVRTTMGRLERRGGPGARED